MLRRDARSRVSDPRVSAPKEQRIIAGGERSVTPGKIFTVGM